MPGFTHDLRLAWRRLRRHPGTSLVAIATLGVGLGAVTVALSVFSTLLLQPLPYPTPHSLLWFQSARLTQPTVEGDAFSPPDFLDLRRAGRGMVTMAAFYPNVATLVGTGPPEHVNYANVSGGFFDLLGVPPQLGRGIEAADEQPDLPQIAVLSYPLWQQRYGGNPGILGHTVNLDNRDLTIVGVMPAGFDYPQGAELWTPEPFTNPLLLVRNSRYLNVVARLAPSQTLNAAQQALQGECRQLAATYPQSNTDRGLALQPLAEHLHSHYRATLWMMLVAALLVLAIACANVANLLLAGAVERWREVALRTSLGAGRARIVRQLITEGLVLTALGGTAGTTLALLLLPLVARLHPPALPQLTGVHLDARVLLLGLAVAAATAVWFGLAPAWELLRPWPGRSLHRAASSAPPVQSALSSLVAAAEVALTVILLVGAGLLLQSLRHLGQVSPGFDSHGVLTFRISELENSLDDIRAQAPLFTQMRLRLAALPGVAEVGMVSEPPLGALQPPSINFLIPGVTALAALPEAQRPQATIRRITPGYFATLHIPLRGRDFTLADDTGHPRVVIVSQALARAWFPGEEPVGRALQWGRPPNLVTAIIVGVAGDVHDASLAGVPVPELYEPFLQSPVPDLTAVLRAAGNPASLLPAIRDTVAGVNHSMPVYDVSSLDASVALATSPERFRSRLLLWLAAVALALAVLGVYSVLAHHVALRARELGVRLALGASPRHLRHLIFLRTLRLLLAGLLLGLMAAWWLSRGLEGWLFGVGRADPLTWIMAPLFLLTAGLLAAVLPALRAGRTAPATVLKCE